MIIDAAKGYVLTNNHVIIDTTGLSATLVSTGQRFTAKWVGYDVADDVAVIKLVGAKGLKAIPLGNSGTAQIGDQVVALGNAEGRGGAVAVSGLITGLNRTITARDGGAGTAETLTGMIQTDAAIVPGDSGGPLASMSGRVIGMNTAAATGNGGEPGGSGQPSQNVGYAIPINKALSIAHQIIAGKAGGNVRIGVTGFLGVLVPSGNASNTTSPLRQRELQIQKDAGTGQKTTPAQNSCVRTEGEAGIPPRVAPTPAGALVLGALCDTAAARSGVRPGDVVIAVGGHRVNSPGQLSKVMLGLRAGAQVQLTWVDVSGQTHRATLTLGQRPPI